jgi:CRISPR-associated endonuclease/helicase Cas3
VSTTSYFAHSSSNPDKSDWQPLSAHLQGVGTLASQYASAFHASEMAQIVGLVHDLGKYTTKFQARLSGSSERTDHATAGAQELFKRYSDLGKLLAFAVAGHHAGLANGIDEGHDRSTLISRLDKKIDSLDAIWQSEINLPNTVTPPQLLPSHAEKREGFQFAFLLRMVFSCLIDADRTDTQCYSLSLKNKPFPRTNFPSLAALRDKLNGHLNSFSSKTARSELNQLRYEILTHAQAQAALPPGLFSMTVPTGGGKTLSSMAFALDHALVHAESHNLRRVIYVIPFTSIIEQNAKVFKDAFGDLSHAVVEHHSAFDREALTKGLPLKAKADYTDKLRIVMESWDAPIIVTTAVQFFESLFADRPSACRKLHNIAGSVIILDEAQTLPLKLLRPVMAAIDELARNYRCTVVLCTATQPALLKEHGFHNGLENVREIAPDPANLFVKLKRTQIQSLGVQTDEQLAAHLREHSQVLMIVNNRRHARKLYDEIKVQPGAYHLSTLMIAKHRSTVLSEVRKKLLAGEPCKLISTSLIEAGVDVDFPRVYRAETGLDSIAQAAGRCNREGKRPLDDSIVSVFESPDWPAPTELAQLTGNMRMVLRTHAGDLLAPEAMQLYFKYVYNGKGTELDSKGILKMHSDHARKLTFPFQNIAKAFTMIESHLLPVIVPCDKGAEKLIDDLRFADSVGSIARSLQPYLVQVPKAGFDALRSAGAISCIETQKYGDQFWRLENMDLYDKHAGLTWDKPEFINAESTVM